MQGGKLGLGGKAVLVTVPTGLGRADPGHVSDQLGRAAARGASRSLGAAFIPGQSSEGLHLTQARLPQDSSPTVCFSSPPSPLLPFKLL